VSGAQSTELIVACAAVTIAIKAAGPIALGGRDLPVWFIGVIALLAAPLLAALVVTQALADGHHVGVGADTVGVATAGAVLWRGGSVLAGVAVAVVITALIRAVT
jgi:branched-subunit amino acid transport protein